MVRLHVWLSCSAAVCLPIACAHCVRRLLLGLYLPQCCLPCCGCDGHLLLPAIMSVTLDWCRLMTLLATHRRRRRSTCTAAYSMTQVARPKTRSSE